MGTEHRLHPLSIVFGLLADLRRFGWPGLAALVAGGIAGLDLLWIAFLGAVYLIVPVTRYLSLRYRFDDAELVVHSGLLFRNERHVPYDRIHHVAAVQGALHRLLGVVEVRLETGSAGETEATLAVVPRSAVDAIRDQVRVRAPRRAPDGADASAQAATTHDARTLLALRTRDLMLYGLVENRGVVLLAAGAALLWEYGIADRLLGRFIGDGDVARESLGEALRSLASNGWSVALAAGGALFLGLVAVVRLLSMAWAAVRLHGFRLERHEDDVRREYGAFTRVQASVARHRIQALTVREGPLHRLLGRASIDIATAGAKDEAGGDDGGRLAPILGAAAVPGLVAEVLPGVALDEVSWRPVHPGAVRRLRRETLAVALPAAAVGAVLLGWWSLPWLGILAAWCGVYPRRYAAHLGWAVSDQAVFFRSGWWWRTLSIAPIDRVQVVSLHESPFDRRAGMARLRVDTAGAAAATQRVDVPYLPRRVARDLRDHLARRAADTTYRW